jgi:hypothetical protein
MQPFITVTLLLTTSVAFALSPAKFRSHSRSAHRSRLLQEQQQQSQQSNTRLNVVQPIPGSKLTQPYTEEEVNKIFQEFNITVKDFDSDPDFKKWAPTNDFFQRVAPNLDVNKAVKLAVQDVKSAFYSNYRVPILPQYKTFVSDLMVTGVGQMTDMRFVPDAIYAFGLCTQYYTIMKGYALQDEIDVIFNEIVKALRLDPVKVRDDAKRVLNFIKENNLSEEEFLNLKEGEVGEIFEKLRTDRFFKYTDAFGVGLCRIMELRNVEPKLENFQRWTQTLRWVNPTRLVQSWAEFNGDQVKMQGVEAMQKQLLIREKKRAAERLEKKAAAFEDKKKALVELNEIIAKRREVLLQEQMNLKKRLDPAEYERILAQQESSASA